VNASSSHWPQRIIRLLSSLTAADVNAPHFQHSVSVAPNSRVSLQHFAQATPSWRDSTFSPQIAQRCGYTSASVASKSWLAMVDGEFIEATGIFTHPHGKLQEKAAFGKTEGRGLCHTSMPQQMDRQWRLFFFSH
jgi:hypothetical protein